MEERTMSTQEPQPAKPKMTKAERREAKARELLRQNAIDAARSRARQQCDHVRKHIMACSGSALSEAEKLVEMLKASEDDRG
jgi:hypothetical protein